jgi:hypothetical protein
MEKLISICDEIDDLRNIVPRVLAGIAGIAMIIAAALLNRF